MTRHARVAAAHCPAAIAIHDDGDVQAGGGGQRSLFHKVSGEKKGHIGYRSRVARISASM
jgi:hypothetical protein